ncbi:MAG TPA: glycosyltransferase, partial [Gaiellaceae bacterium]|nr:glycosyltransferase [Gaiellaceae bacterium]
LERQAVERGIEARARFLGSVSREDVLRLFRAADASVLSSAWENFPHTVVEALAVGCPVIATAVGGVPEVVRDGENGLLVPPKDVAALADAIRRFFDDHELRRRLAEAASRSVSGYTEEAVFTRIEAELARVVAP